ncbi:unnamed protein product [Trichobilharzia szidati]|nr:unnamed protein product [Trichobilharzia szidati]
MKTISSTGDIESYDEVIKILSDNELQSSSYPERLITNEELKCLKEAYWKRKYGRVNNYKIRLFLCITFILLILCAIAIIVISILLLYFITKSLKYLN